MKKRFFTFLLVLQFFQSAFACSCFDTGSFCESIGFLNEIDNSNYNVVLAQISEKEVEGIKVNVLHTFFGQSSPGTEFSIKNGSSLMCTISTDQFSVGDLSLFILEFPATQQQSLSACGTFFLSVENDLVIGHIAPGISEMDLADFSELPDCGKLRQWNAPKFELFPTLLTDDEPIVVTPYFFKESTNATIRVYNVPGRLVFKQVLNDLDNEGPIEIDTKGWATGVYFCQFDYLGKRNIVKIVKAS